MSQIIKPSKQNEMNFLLISLVQDIKCLDEIVGQILDSAESFQLNSWLFPHKNVNECMDYYKSYEKEEKTYVECLELIIEKLYVMFNFLNLRKVINKQRRNIQFPHRLTLGRCAQKFWELNSTEENVQYRNISDSTLNLVIDKECQTDNFNLTHCKSCSQVDEFMKSMIKFLSNNFEDSCTKKMLTDLNEHLFTTTKFGGTLKFVECIKKDYQTAVKTMNDKTLENNILMEDIRRKEMDINENDSKIKELKVSKHKLTEKLTNSRNELTRVKNQIETLQKENERLQQSSDIYGPVIDDLTKQIKTIQEEKKHLQQNCDIRESQLDELTKQVEELQEERMENNKNIEHKLENYENIIDDYKLTVKNFETKNSILQKDLNEVRNKHEQLYCKFSRMCRMNNHLEKNLSDITNVITNLGTLVEGIQESIENITMTSTKLNEKIKTLTEKHDEEKMYTEKFYNLHKFILDMMPQNKDDGGIERNVVSGNPLLDFRRQIEENELTIENLEAQNRKFASIVKIYQKNS